MRKSLFLAAVLSVAGYAYASDDIMGTYLMNTTDEYGKTSQSEVTVTASETPGMVEVSGIIGSEFKGTVLTASVDESSRKLTFQSGQNGEMWGSSVKLSLFAEADSDFTPVDGPLVANLTADGKFVFEGIWGFIYTDDNEIAFIVLEAELVRPNATMNYLYQSSAMQQFEGSVPQFVQYKEGRLTIDGFNPILTDEMGPMTFIIDEDTSTATLADPETPNTSGYYEDNYLCTITEFSGNYQNPGLKFTKGLTCTIKDDNTLVFPSRWGIVRINREETSAEPMIRGMYAGGTLELTFPIILSGINMTAADVNDTTTVYYDLTGRRLASPSGICIVVSGGKASKVAFPQSR